MNSQNKVTLEKKPVSEIGKSEGAETQDEIQKIMSEIESLQDEMNAVSEVNPLVEVALPPISKEELVSTPEPGGSRIKLLKAESQNVSPVFATELEEEASAVQEKMVRDSITEVSEQDEVSEQEMERDILKEFSGGGEEPWLEATMANLKSIPHSDRPGNKTKKAKASQIREVIETEEKEEEDQEDGEAAGGELTMAVKGNMTLKLFYEKTGQLVILGFNGEAIKIQLADGTEINVPNRKRNPYKAA